MVIVPRTSLGTCHHHQIIRSSVISRPAEGTVGHFASEADRYGVRFPTQQAFRPQLSYSSCRDLWTVTAQPCSRGTLSSEHPIFDMPRLAKVRPNKKMHHDTRVRPPAPCTTLPVSTAHSHKQHQQQRQQQQPSVLQVFSTSRVKPKHSRRFISTSIAYAQAQSSSWGWRR